jgi:hypothetical protein
MRPCIAAAASLDPPAFMDSSDGSLTSRANGRLASHWRDCLSRTSFSASCTVQKRSATFCSIRPLMMAFASTTAMRCSSVEAKTSASAAAFGGASVFRTLAHEAMAPGPRCELGCWGCVAGAAAVDPS